MVSIAECANNNKPGFTESRTFSVFGSTSDMLLSGRVLNKAGFTESRAFSVFGSTSDMLLSDWVLTE
jgi:hypothetical protein